MHGRRGCYFQIEGGRFINQLNRLAHSLLEGICVLFAIELSQETARAIRVYLLDPHSLAEGGHGLDKVITIPQVKGVQGRGSGQDHFLVFVNGMGGGGAVVLQLS
jgi:hypothetical protein